jgi:3-deoxy-D-manno-octulosonic-acid transferase
MIWLYRLLFLPIFIISLPRLMLHTWKRGNYRRGFLQRFGLFKKIHPTQPKRKRLWIHGVSVGEIRLLEPLIYKLSISGNYTFVFSSTSSTGLQVARSLYEKFGPIVAFPIDFWPFSRSAWGRIKPDLLLHADGELWPEHLHQAHMRGVPVFVVNARISPTSYRRYCKFPFFARWILSRVHKFFPCGQETVQQLYSLGVNDGKICHVGNVKCDRRPRSKLCHNKRIALLKKLAIVQEDATDCDVKVLFGCSTWPGEEKLLINVLNRLRLKSLQWRLVLVPRHGERRAELRKLLELTKLQYHFWTDNCRNNCDAIISVVDVVGELEGVIAAATVAFLGKTLPPNGGAQSPLDAIAAGVPLVSGPCVGNFRDIVNPLLQHNAIIVKQNEKDVADALIALASDDRMRRQLSAAGIKWLRENAGATDKICTHISQIFS